MLGKYSVTMRGTPIFVLGIFILGSSSLYAASNPTPPLAVVLPDLRPGFEFSIAALGLKAGASNLNYVIYNKELPAQSPTWSEREIRQSYDWAFALGVGYVFPEAKDVSLHWTHLNTSASSTTIAPNSSYFLGPDYEIGPAALPIRKAIGSSQFKYDVINLDAGQYVDFGNHVEVRFFAGLSNAYLREQVNATYSGNTVLGAFPGPFYTKQRITADFTGLGPRVGMNGSFLTDSGLGFFGEAAVSALIGQPYSKTTYTSSARELQVIYDQTINNQFIKDQGVLQVIPAIDAKIGASYKHEFGNCWLLGVKLGYQAAVYVNAINQYIPGSLVVGAPLDTGGIFVATMSHTQSNYSVQGPFLEASLQV